MYILKSVTITHSLREMTNPYLFNEPWSVFCERILDTVVNSALGTVRHNTLSERQAKVLCLRIDNLIASKSPWNVKHDEVLFEYNWVHEHIPTKSWEEQARDDFMADAIEAAKRHLDGEEA